MHFLSRIKFIAFFAIPCVGKFFIFLVMRYRLICFLPVVNVICLMPIHSISDEPKFEITSSAILTKHPAANFYHAEFDLGSLPSAKSGHVALVLENPTDRSFKVSKITKFCNCVDVKSTDGVTEIGPKSIRHFSMKLITPRTSEDGRAFASLSLRDESGDALIDLRIKYQLSGVLSIKQKLHSCEIGPNAVAGQIRIPVLLTPPIRVDDLRLELSRSLRDLPFEIKTLANSETFVVADVPSVVVDSGPLSGEVRIIDGVTKRADGCFVTIMRGSDVRISPAVMRFVEHHDDKSKLTASAILSLPRPSPNELAEDNAKNWDKRTEHGPRFHHERNNEIPKHVSDDQIRYRILDVNLLVGGKQADVEVKRLSDRVFRLVLEIQKGQSLDSEKGVEWKLSIDPLGRRELQSRFIINE